MTRSDLAAAVSNFRSYLCGTADKLSAGTVNSVSQDKELQIFGETIADLLALFDVSTSVPGIDPVAGGGVPGFGVANLNDMLAKATQTPAARLVTIGSSGALALLVSGALPLYRPGKGRLILDRSVHTSLYGTLEDSGYEVDWVCREFCSLSGTERPVNPEQIVPLLERQPKPAAIILTSPTYDGVYSDIAAISSAADLHGVPVIVDSAWGTNSQATSGTAFPTGAIANGATASVVSLHKKSLGVSQTSSAFFKCEKLAQAFDEASHKRHTTSPYYPALLVLEARLGFVLDGRWREAWTRAAASAVEFVTRLAEIAPLVRHINFEDVGGVAGDPCHVLLNIRQTGISGFDLSDALSQRGCVIEKATIDTILILFGPGHVGAVDRLLVLMRQSLAACQVVDRNNSVQLCAQSLMLSESPLTVREASRAARRLTPIDLSVGCISAELVTVYPPGTALIVPGEIITSDQVKYIEWLRQAGGRVIQPSPVGLIQTVDRSPML